ncbi:hypothetical protein [Phocaeicola plebeius]|jgi:hypothetical protein|uniref:hypothetical protein n=1 Tax=Phocaeicola plebeius TaxID=310297 RepID=UPI0026EE596A|nr:hypothetical protein [Phocaeicola plebeius]
MSYGLIYTLPFASKDGKVYEVKIEREGYTGKVTELKGQTSPFTATIDSEEFIYTPTRFSTATMAIFGGDYLQDLFSTDYRMHRITLYANGVAVWCGFIKPELYTQDYSSDKFNLEINCYSAMSVLEFVEYKQAGEERGFVSLWSLLKKCVEESRGLYTAIYIPHVYSVSQSEYNNWNNPLESMMVSEQNFFDEDDNPMSLKEVLEEIMKLMNWTCADWNGELFFIDVDNEDGEYYKYTSEMSSYTQIQADGINVQDIGFAGNDHTLDILPGYNKASIRCSNYPVGDALPKIDFDDFEDIGTVEDSYTNLFRRFVWKRPNNEKILMNAFQYNYLGDKTPHPIDISKEKELFESGQKSQITGAIPQNYDFIEKDESGNPSRVDWEYKERIVIPLSPNQKDVIFQNPGEYELIKIKGVPSVYNSEGVFAINFSTEVARITYYNGNQVYADRIKSYDFRFKLRIGNNYYHGRSDGSYYWDNNPDYNPSYPNNLEINWKGEAAQGSADISKYEGTYDLITSRTLNDGLDGLKGYIIKLPDDRIIAGDLELIIYAPRVEMAFTPTLETMYLNSFELNYQKYKDYGKDDDNSDRIYENIVNENYINELDEIEFKISSYNNDGACYSKVTMNNEYLTNNLYCGITASSVRPEEFLIRRIVDHYSAPKIKLTQVIKNANIKPYTVLSDKYSVNKKYINAGGEIDYRKNRFNCIMIEI